MLFRSVLLTGLSMRSAERLMNEMRDYLGKKEHEFVSVGEAIKYLGLPAAEAYHALGIEEIKAAS